MRGTEQLSLTKWVEKHSHVCDECKWLAFQRSPAGYMYGVCARGPPYPTKSPDAPACGNFEGNTKEEV
ncbi:MAG: hypothetical protein ABC588_08580 [Candidatus Methanosuratincola petrocarbonis]